jgi:hypothetical protein
MEALAAPGSALVHSTAAGQWAAEAPCRSCPPITCVECKGRGLQCAAEFDLGGACFRPAPALSDWPEFRPIRNSSMP